jgi:predicted DNA-binding WGR domain protein
VILIRRRDPNRRMARLYGLGMQADLLAGWALVREWGRIGRHGRVRADAYSELAVAEAVGQQLEAAKRRKGYR